MIDYKIINILFLLFQILIYILVTSYGFKLASRLLQVRDLGHRSLNLSARNFTTAIIKAMAKKKNKIDFFYVISLIIILISPFLFLPLYTLGLDSSELFSKMEYNLLISGVLYVILAFLFNLLVLIRKESFILQDHLQIIFRYIQIHSLFLINFITILVVNESFLFSSIKYGLFAMPVSAFIFLMLVFIYTNMRPFDNERNSLLVKGRYFSSESPYYFLIFKIYQSISITYFFIFFLITYVDVNSIVKYMFVDFKLNSYVYLVISIVIFSTSLLILSFMSVLLTRIFPSLNVSGATKIILKVLYPLSFLNLFITVLIKYFGGYL